MLIRVGVGSRLFSIKIRHKNRFMKIKTRVLLKYGRYINDVVESGFLFLLLREWRVEVDQKECRFPVF